jgi:hypothetical protein
MLRNHYFFLKNGGGEGKKGETKKQKHKGPKENHVLFLNPAISVRTINVNELNT